MKFVSKKRQKGTLESGDVFLIPLDNGQFSIGMFHKYIQTPLYSAICSFYPDVVAGEEGVVEQMLSNPICIKLVMTNGLETKKWLVVANCESKISIKALPDYKYRKKFLKRKQSIMEKVHGDGTIRKFLKAYHGLIPWNTMHDPEYFDKLLLDIKFRPKTILFE